MTMTTTTTAMTKTTFPEVEQRIDIMTIKIRLEKRD